MPRVIEGEVGFQVHSGAHRVYYSPPPLIITVGSNFPPQVGTFLCGRVV